MNLKWERRVCAKECTAGVSRGNLGVLSFASSLVESREVLPTASDAAGSLRGLDASHSLVPGA